MDSQADKSSHHRTPQPLEHTMSQSPTIKLLPGELAFQVAVSMKWKDTDMPVSIPSRTTWKDALNSINDALGGHNRAMTVRKPRTLEQQTRFRDLALENAKAWNSAPPPSKETQAGRLIRTKYDTATLPRPKPASRETVERLKENMIPFKDITNPYPVVLTAAICERKLPVVKANITVNGIDAAHQGGVEELEQVDMLWDTGAQSTIITEDLLSESFRQFLGEPYNDQYRSQDMRRVQVDATIALSNTPIYLSVIALVVPRSVVPNERTGIIFGQSQCINHMSYRSIPRSILVAKGQDIDEEIWGDIVVDEYINEFGDLVPV